MKKLMLLGGSAQQVVAIEKAKELGYFTILCDYLPDNPGQYVADKFYQTSTTDKNAVLKVAQLEKIDGIVAYASDPAAPTAAYVAEQMELPTNPYKSVEILSEKHKFRDYLDEAGFNVPRHCSFTEADSKMKNKVNTFNFPVMIKPVDSSGSKGISKIESISEFCDAVEYAKKFSRNGIIQAEEYIQKDHMYMVGGDIFVLNGKVEFYGLLNCHRDDTVNPLVPVGKSYPLDISENRRVLIYDEIQKLLSGLDIKFGAFNVELMITKDDKLYFIEMGPRNGGNMIPDMLSMISGIDLVEATIRTAMGDNDINIAFKGNDKLFATHNLHTDKNGIYNGIEFSDEIEKSIVKKSVYKENGDTVEYFDSANKAIGIVFMEFDSHEQMKNILNNVNSHIKIIVDKVE